MTATELPPRAGPASPPAVHPAHTSCKDCCFALYRAHGPQTGCAFGDRTATFATRGQLLEAEDTERQFYLVNGTRCTAFRDDAWARQHADGDRVAAARRELTLRVDAVVYLEGAVDEAALTRTLGALHDQVLRPSSVAVVSNQDALPLPRLHALLFGLAKGLTWTLTDVVERLPGGGRVSRGRALDVVAAKLNGHFYTVWSPGSLPPPRFLLDLDRAVTDGLARFAVLLPDDAGEGLTVALGFHNSAMVEGNRPLPRGLFDPEPPEVLDTSDLLPDVAAKAAHVARAHGIPWLVARRADVCSQ